MSAQQILPTHADALSALSALAEGFDLGPEVARGIDPVEADLLPPSYRRLLDHTEHMTPTLKAFHGRAVALKVLAYHDNGPWYRRKIVLTIPPREKIVEFGLVRINLGTLDDKVRDEVTTRRRPLGDILISSGVMTRVNPLWFLRIQSSSCLASYLEPPSGEPCFGRLATIYCDGRPAIELLEIVSDVRVE